MRDLKRILNKYVRLLSYIIEIGFTRKKRKGSQTNNGKYWTFMPLTTITFATSRAYIVNTITKIAEKKPATLKKLFEVGYFYVSIPIIFL
jgi:hypothetical protein